MVQPHRPHLRENKLLLLATSVLLLLLVSACATRIRIPKPGDPILPAPAVPDPGDSIVEIPIEVPLQTAINEAEQQVPIEQGEEDNWQDGGNIVGHVNFQYKYRFWRDPFRVSGSGNTLLVSVPARYRVRGRIHPSPINIEGSCGYGPDPVKRLNPGLATALSWTSGYALSSTTTVQPLDFVDPCRVTALNIDATPVMKFLLQPKLQNAASAFDHRLSSISNFRPRATMLWNQLQQPLPVAPDLWLVLNPARLRAGALGFSNGLISTSVGLVARPRLIAGRQPKPGTIALPDLDTTSAPTGSLHIPFEADFPFSEANKTLAQQLVGTELVLTGNKKLTITNVQVYGSGGSAILSVGVKGKVKGTVYFIGKPSFDVATQSIRFQDVDFTLESRNILAKLASWLLHERFVNLIRERAVLNVTEDIRKAKEQLTSMLNRDITPEIQLSGSISELRPVGIFLTDNSFRAQVVAEGTAKIKVR